MVTHDKVALSEGARRLASETKRRTIRAVARSLECSEAGVRFWISGARQPNEAVRTRARELYGIDPVSWERPAPPASAAQPSDPAPPGASSHAEPHAATAGHVGPAPVARPEERTPRARLRQLATRLEDEIATCGPDTPKSHLASLSQALGMTLTRLDRCEPVEKRFIQSTAWANLLNAVEEAGFECSSGTGQCLKTAIAKLREFSRTEERDDD